MLTHASCGQLVAVVRAELATNVAPKVTDDVARVALGMIDSVLQHIENRIDREQTVIFDEIAAVSSLTEDLFEAAPEHTSWLRAELAAINERTDPADLRQQYDRATSLLCGCVQAVESADESLRHRVRELLQMRLDNELAIRGDFAFTR